jgi:hypothetical protein
MSIGAQRQSAADQGSTYIMKEFLYKEGLFEGVFPDPAQGFRADTQVRSDHILREPL